MRLCRAVVVLRSFVLLRDRKDLSRDDRQVARLGVARCVVSGDHSPDGGHSWGGRTHAKTDKGGEGREGKRSQGALWGWCVCRCLAPWVATLAEGAKSENEGVGLFGFSGLA